MLLSNRARQVIKYSSSTYKILTFFHVLYRFVIVLLRICFPVFPASVCLILNISERRYFDSQAFFLDDIKKAFEVHFVTFKNHSRKTRARG